MPVMWFAIVANERTHDVATLIDKHVQKKLEAVDGRRVSARACSTSRSGSSWTRRGEGRAARSGALVQRLNDNFAQPLGEVKEAERSTSCAPTCANPEIRDYPVRQDGLRIRISAPSSA